MKRYAALIAEWKTANERARAAEQELSDRFYAYLEGRGAEPTEEDKRAAHALRELERQALDRALQYVWDTALPDRKRKSTHTPAAQSDRPPPANPGC